MPSPFVLKRGVPILDEHELKDEDGETIVKVDRKRLEDICKKNNDRIEQTGDLTPFVVGHTRDGAPEDEQPEIVGFATKFYCKPLGKTGRYAIHADAKFYADKKHLVNKFPRRSVELWTDDWKIDPIALLGATTPERDLGLLQLSKSGRRKIRRVLYEKPMPFPPTQQSAQGSTCGPNSQPELGGGDPQVASIVQGVLSALQETDVWQFMQQQMEESAAMSAEPPIDQGLGGEPPLPPEASEQDLYPDEGGEDYGDEGEEGDDYEDEEEEDEEPVRMSSVSMPSGTNTFTPTSRRQMSRPTQPQRTARRQSQSGPAVPPEIMDRVRTAANASRLRYARQEQQIQIQNQEIVRLKYQATRERREKDLIQLEAEGVVFDRVEELDDVMQMPEKFYQKHLVKLRKRYQRAPIGRIQYSAEDYRTSTAERDRDSVQRAVEYATEHNVSYAQALKDLEG